MSSKAQNAFNLCTKIYGLQAPINTDAYFLTIIQPLLTGLDIAQSSSEEEMQNRMIERLEVLFTTLKNRIRNKNRLYD